MSLPNTPKKASSTPTMADVSKMRRDKYYEKQTPEQARQKGVIYQEERARQQSVSQSAQRADIAHALATSNQIEQERKEKEAYEKRVLLEAQNEQKRRVVEEKQSQARLDQIRQQKKVAAALPAQIKSNQHHHQQHLHQQRHYQQQPRLHHQPWPHQPHLSASNQAHRPFIASPEQGQVLGGARPNRPLGGAHPTASRRRDF